MDVDLRDLELLEALRVHRTLTAAARVLFVSQPALSQRLTRLESRVGLRLFDRLDRQLVPTDAGRRLLQTAGAVLGELRSAQRDLELLAGAGDVVVRIATQYAPEAIRRSLPVALAQVRHALAGVDVRLQEQESDLLGALDSGRIDIALIAVLDASLTRARLTPLFDYEQRVLVAADHPWASRPYVPIEDFVDVHLVQSPDYDRKRNPYALPLPGDVRPRKLTIVPGEPHARFDMVSTSKAVTIVPAWFADLIGDRNLVSVQIGESPLCRTWYAATRPRQAADEVAAVLALLPELFLVGRTAGTGMRLVS